MSNLRELAQLRELAVDRKVFESLNIAMLLVDREGKVINVNPILKEIINAPLFLAIPRHISELISVDDGENRKIDINYLSNLSKTPGIVSLVRTDSLWQVQAVAIDYENISYACIFSEPDCREQAESTSFGEEAWQKRKKIKFNNEEVWQDKELLKEMATAIKKDQFFHHYQPQIDLKTGMISGMEALVRWQHPEKGCISPNGFIPVLEESELIEKFTLYLIKKALADGCDWRKSGHKKFTLAINMPGNMLSNKELFARLMSCLEQSDFPTEALEIEFTESAMIEQIDNALMFSNLCHGAGIKLALDDFGTGYSSFNYLRELPIDKIKIDRTFVAGIADKKRDADMLAAIIEFGKKLNFKVLVEGVEDEEQLQFLQKHGCDYLQGFHFSKPLDAGDINRLLTKDTSVALQHQRIRQKFILAKL